MHMKRSQRLWGISAGILLLAGACGYPDAEQEIAAPQDPEFALVDALEDKYGIVGNTLATQELIAIQPDLADCMSDAGFEYWPEDKTLELDFATRMATFMFEADAYPSDIDEARSEGFGVGAGLRAAYDDGLTTVDPAVPGRKENQEYINTLSPEAEGAYGAAMGACREATGQRLEEIHAISELAGRVTGAAMAEMGSRSDYSKMISEWQSCMAASGFDRATESPEHLRDLVMSWYFEDEGLVATGVPLDMDRFAELQSREAAAAVSSVECGAAEEFGKKVDQILQQEIDAELTRRGLSLHGDE